jgi:ubiquinone/menaquinone biosynthesis C-methylase UbiE
MTAPLSRLLKHPRVRSVLDSPGLFAAFRFLLVGAQSRTHALVRQTLDVDPTERVLDVCCGIGEFARDVDAQYVGIDLNPRFIETASSRYAGSPGKNFRVMDALQMEFPDKSFDRCIFINGLHHFSDADGRRLLREIRRVTRRGVIIIDADGTPRGVVRRALLAADRGEWMRTPDALRSLIGEAFEIREVVRFDVGLYTELLHVCRAG